MDPEKELREKIVDTFRLMAAVKPDLFSETEKRVMALFKEAAIPYTISHINAYLEGMRFVGASPKDDKGMSIDAMMTGFLMTAVANKETELAKLKNV